jgi:hypothetical protein
MYWLVAEKRLFIIIIIVIIVNYLVRFIFRGSDILRSCSRHEIQNSTGDLTAAHLLPVPGGEGFRPVVQWLCYLVPIEHMVSLRTFLKYNSF